MTEPTAANLRALGKTVYAYEKSIADIENGMLVDEVMKRWKNYGSAIDCHLCKSVRTSSRLRLVAPNCEKCVLWKKVNPHFYPCAAEAMTKTLADLMKDIGEESKHKFPKSLRARLKAILKRVDERGYELTVIG